jgi:hypothetical protein
MFHKRSSVINFIYCGQQLFSYEWCYSGRYHVFWLKTFCPKNIWSKHYKNKSSNDQMTLSFQSNIMSVKYILTKMCVGQMPLRQMLPGQNACWSYAYKTNACWYNAYYTNGQSKMPVGHMPIRQLLVGQMPLRQMPPGQNACWSYAYKTNACWYNAYYTNASVQNACWSYAYKTNACWYNAYYTNAVCPKCLLVICIIYEWVH